MPSESTSQQVYTPKRLELRILLVEDDLVFRSAFRRFLEEYASDYYHLRIFEEETVADGLCRLEEAYAATTPFDIVLLDYYLPPTLGAPPVPDATLLLYCAQHRSCCGWVASLTSFADDKGLIEWWQQNSFRLDEMPVRPVQKSSDGLLQLAGAMFFREVRVPLDSDWLPLALGEDIAVIPRGTDPLPRGFNVYRFVRRLGDVWPKLDPKSQKRAAELFSIEVGDNAYDPPKRIGFRSFGRVKPSA